MIKGFTAALLLAVLLFAAPLAQAAAPAIPVKINNAAGQFDGSLNIKKFELQNNKIVAVGTLTGTVTNRAGQAVGSVVQSVALPVLASSTSGCPVLHLELGPLDLNLLGLVVHLDKVVLDITAQPGTLLGGLLCSLSNIFSGLLQGLNLLAILAFLNDILGAL